MYIFLSARLASRQVLQRRLEAVGDVADEDVRLYPAVELVVHWPEAEVVLHFPERLLDLSLDHVLPPQRRRVGVRHVRPEQICSLVPAGLADAVEVERPREVVLRHGRFRPLRDFDPEKAPAAPGFRTRHRQAGDQLVARKDLAVLLHGEPVLVVFLPAPDPDVDRMQHLQHRPHPPEAHGVLLRETLPAVREDVLVGPVRGELHADPVLHMRPLLPDELRPQRVDHAARSPHEVAEALGAHVGEGLLRRDAPVHEPEAVELPAVAVLLHETVHELHLRALVRRVARHHLVGERKSVGGQH